MKRYTTIQIFFTLFFAAAFLSGLYCCVVEWNTLYKMEAAATQGTRMSFLFEIDTQKRLCVFGTVATFFMLVFLSLPAYVNYRDRNDKY